MQRIRRDSDFYADVDDDIAVCFRWFVVQLVELLVKEKTKSYINVGFEFQCLWHVFKRQRTKQCRESIESFALLSVFLMPS